MNDFLAWQIFVIYLIWIGKEKKKKICLFNRITNWNVITKKKYISSDRDFK